LKQVFNDLSDSTEENKENNYTNLMISVKNLMSDQHIVHKNFLDEFTKLRTFLLEKFDTNWLCSNFFSLYNLSLDARYALKSSGQPDDEQPPEASKLQAVRILLIAALS
jgi:hypothetical protein